MWRNQQELAERLRSDVMQIMLGDLNPGEVKRALMRDYDVAKWQASRLVDTEITYVQNRVALDRYRDRGYQRMMVMCLEVNSCDKCQALDGEVFDINDVPVLPIHPNCHCAYCVPYDGDEAEITGSGSDLEAIYKRKGVGEGSAKQYSPRGQTAIEKLLAEGKIMPASALGTGAAAPTKPVSGNALRAKVEARMAEASPKAAEAEPATVEIIHPARPEMHVEAPEAGKILPEAPANKGTNADITPSNQSKDASTVLPKTIKQQEAQQLTETIEVDIPDAHGIVPTGSQISKVIVIAGEGTSTALRDAPRLTTEYADMGPAYKWQKKAGTVEGKHFAYELHWYENAGKVSKGETKLKRVKRK